MLYLLIGILATALVAVGLYLFLSRDTEKRSETANTATPNANNNNTANTTPSPVANANKPANTVPATNPALSPNGNWTGQITYPSGTAFSAQASLADAGNGQMKGQILWTLLRTANPQKMGMAGMSATEFVQGAFDMTTQTLSIAGYNTNDPNHLIILDKYRLTMSTDGRSLSGFSYGGKSRGKFDLRK